MKQIRIICLLTAAVVLVSIVGGMAGCSRKGPPPTLEDVYDRLVEVIEKSHEVNVFMFGEGLPVYPRGDAEDQLLHRYYGVVDNGRVYVTPYAKYDNLAAMQDAMAEVYSTSYRESIGETLFTGFADAGISASMPARYAEDEKALYQSEHVTPLVSGVKLYDYAGMKIMDGSHATYIRVSIPSMSEAKPGEWTTSELSFVYENGNWYLDSPSC